MPALDGSLCAVLLGHVTAQPSCTVDIADEVVVRHAGEKVVAAGWQVGIF
jgi:hypothetical protein